MWRRYLLTAPMHKLRLGFGFGFEEFSNIKITPRFNVAPGQGVPIVRARR